MKYSPFAGENFSATLRRVVSDLLHPVRNPLVVDTATRRPGNEIVRENHGRDLTEDACNGRLGNLRVELKAIRWKRHAFLLAEADTSRFEVHREDSGEWGWYIFA